jgi:phosphatidylserine/phosphatidylglycerophosphate/cardiolipin synthase-like enzyme
MLRGRILTIFGGLSVIGALASACAPQPPVTIFPADAGLLPEDADVSAPDASGSSPDAAQPADAGSTPSTVTVIVEPSDRAGALLAAINAAKTSLHVTMYLLTDYRFTNALIARHQAGVEVKVVLNQNFPSGQSNGNANSFTRLTNAGVSVVWASSTFTYTHEKCVIIDGSSAWIMTMNLTSSAPTSNREYLALDTDPADVAEAEAIFAGDFAGMPPGTASGDLLVAPLNARDRLVGMIGGAQHTVDIEDEEFSDYMIANAVADAAGRGVKVRIVIANSTPTASQSAAVSQVKIAGASVVATASPYIHAKAIIVDGSVLFVGSENLSTGSLQHNRELGLITNAPAEIAKVAAAIGTDYGNGVAQ